MQNLGTLGGTFGGASAINDRGQVVGQSDLPGDLVTHAFLWEHGTMRDLGILGGTFATGGWLNDAGDVIGFSTTPGNETIHGFLWRHGVMTDLGIVDGDNASNAVGINVRGQVVGQSWFFDGENVTASQAFVWEKGGPIIDLNTLVSPSSNLDLFEADFITDQGEIVARGFTATGDVHTAILIPDGERTDIAPTLSADAAEQSLSATSKHRNLTPEMLRVLNSPSAQDLRSTDVRTWSTNPAMKKRF
jgi:probable HAF family extracellular repeat protein